MIFEGRRYWPRPLWRFFHRWERRRLIRLFKARKEAITRGERGRAIEYGIDMSSFPLTSVGTRRAMYPTRLGNLITEYEYYPTRKYSADGIFYWYRIWMILPKDLRDLLDEQQSFVDASVYISFTLYLYLPVGIVYSLLKYYCIVDLLPNISIIYAMTISLLSCIFGYVIYRASLRSHTQYGEYMKAMFDQFIWEVKVDSVLEVIERKTGEKWIRHQKSDIKFQISWRYLRWHRYRRFKSKKNVNIGLYE
jgi:hypothetical protein